MNWTAVIEKYISEGLSVSGGKGDSTAKDAEKSASAFTNTLHQAFSTQFANQSGVLNFLRDKLTNNINNPTGLDPATKAVLNSNAINTNATETQNAVKAEQASAASHGGAGLGDGVQAQIQGQLAGTSAASTAHDLGSIQLADQDLKNKNYWNSVTALGGVSGQMDPLSYAADANGGSNAVAGLSDAFSNSQNSGFWNHLVDGFGSTLGKTLGGGNGVPSFGGGGSPTSGGV